MYIYIYIYKALGIAGLAMRPLTRPEMRFAFEVAKTRETRGLDHFRDLVAKAMRHAKRVHIVELSAC